ncbi:hypothetical protein GCM10011348_08880 [Marinobacterium nitratireducens]|uniref:4-alpha-L-fucosyltransferase n=1 Tax=Marinobacterium nitratireducens TaxID=518897 RepID=A0A917Z8Z0_9GAMM|nr:TDP-N-acetylfucosamine:lipid II N-acetylfucosaminyltransferase [Marinobacterium nitratireducens]GGO78009.1 hypothetical protein GCM10011348_08880 [Marinobacterium nitratireducens]
MKNRIVHVFKANKFVSPYIELISKSPEFKGQSHTFWVSGDTDKFPLTESSDIISSRGVLGRPYSFLKLFWLFLVSDKVILHGLFDRKLIYFLFINAWALPKCYWVIWGADLYGELRKRKKLKDKIHSFCKRFVIRKVGHLVTHVKGDVDIAKERLRNSGHYHHCILYTSNIFEFPLHCQPVDENRGLDVLVGNSADPSNNHIEAFERLSCVDNLEMRVYSPLSYGKNRYSEKVEDSGIRFFGENFKAVKDFMPYEDYLCFLKTKDVAIFNHDRQQALGNIINLLGMGKVVFLRSDIATWDYMQNLGLTVFDVRDIQEMASIVSLDLSENVEIVRREFCLQKLIDQWNRIFSF